MTLEQPGNKFVPLYRLVVKTWQLPRFSGDWLPLLRDILPHQDLCVRW
jgi:hypothetical protein